MHGASIGRYHAKRKHGCQNRCNRQATGIITVSKGRNILALRDPLDNYLFSYLQPLKAKLAHVYPDGFWPPEQGSV
ncbi:hypothetical protein [Yoonia sp.]|uniref:hypothetical protein n=1 Tax=Yoonia sp. TaxID=2212373 RepID=UPI002DFEE901|nr:hypothetical protein [Yoonia sp.]